MGQKEESRRKATVVYSGGDDLFIVGAWDDILELSLDIRILKEPPKNPQFFPNDFFF